VRAQTQGLALSPYLLRLCHCCRIDQQSTPRQAIAIPTSHTHTTVHPSPFEGLDQNALHTYNKHTSEADYNSDNRDDEAWLGPTAYTMARVYADVNQQMPRAYWDYDSVNISWGVLENYEVVRKIGMYLTRFIVR